MSSRKNPLIDLERYRTHFFLAGLAISLWIIIEVFSINFSEPQEEPKQEIVIDGDEIVIPITIQKPKKVKVEQVKELPSELNVVDDQTVVDNELDMSATETDEDEYLLQDDNVRFVEGDVEVIEAEEDDLETLEDPIPFAVVESVPVFPGCDNETDNLGRKSCFQKQLLSFVASNFEYPEAARQLKIQGRVIISFVVEKDGGVSNIEILRGVDPWLDEEALRVIKSLPNIQPARQRGKPVRMSFVVPIKIELKE